MHYAAGVRRVLAVVLCTTFAVSAAAQIPPASIRTPENEVADGFISYLHGILYRDAVVGSDGESFRLAFPEFLPESHSPIYDLNLIRRTPDGTLTLGFVVPLRYLVEVDLLGLHPVELQGSRLITLEERVRPGEEFSLAIHGYPELPPDAEELLVLAVTSGYLRVDFAPWLDVMALGFLDDVEVLLVATVRFRGEWAALFGGLNPDGKPMAWAFNMGNSKFMISPPRPLIRLARGLVEAEASLAAGPR